MSSEHIDLPYLDGDGIVDRRQAIRYFFLLGGRWASHLHLGEIVVVQAQSVLGQASRMRGKNLECSRQLQQKIEKNRVHAALRLKHGTEGWFEVKPDIRLKSERVARRLAAAAVHFAQSGRRFRVVTDKQLDTEPRASNVLEVMYQRRAPLTSVELERFRHKLRSESPQTMSEFTSLVGLCDAWRLLGLGIVGVDLDQPIVPDAAIYLEGGHRHADLFA